MGIDHNAFCGIGQELAKIDVSASVALTKMGVTITGGGIIDKVELLIKSLSQNIEKRTELEQKLAQKENG